MYDEYNILKDTFTYNLSQYGVEVLVNNRPVKAIFKMRMDDSGKGKDQYLTMFTDFSDNVQQGDEIILNNKQYLALKDNSDENTVYNKTHCIDCNQVIKYELRRTGNTDKADLTTFHVNADDLSSSVLTSGGVSTLQSTCHFTFPLNELTKRINLNDRFFSGQSKTGVWKIRDINYQNGFCEVYCNRDTITDSDDIENMIADRWLFEHKPDTYIVTITPKTFTIMEEDTQQLMVEVLKNNETVSPTPQIIYSVDEPAIVSIDPETNIATGLKEGSAIISGSYKGQDNDICVVGKSVATITPKPVVADIVITPPYPDGKTAYPVKQGYDATTFTASISGVENPQWTIVLDAQGIASSKYTSQIDNSAGTFSVACNSKNYGTYLKYTISESTTGKTLDYYIELAAMS